MPRKLDETIGTYDFDDDDSTDAAGFGEFIVATVADLPDDEFVVYVYDEQGRAAKKAWFVRQTLTDGSTVVELNVEFDRQYDKAQGR